MKFFDRFLLLRYRFSLIFLCCVTICGGQQKEEQLLRHLAAAKTDTAKILALGDLAWELKTSNIDKAKEYSAQELLLARRYGNKKWLAYAYNDRGTIEFLLGNFIETEKMWLDALAIRRELHDTTGAASILGKLGNVYTKKGQYAEALEMQLECLKAFEALGNHANIAMILGNISTLYSELENDKKAYEYAWLALNESLQYGTKQAIQNSYSTLARVLINRHQPDSALDLYRHAQHIAVEIDDKFTQSIINNNIAGLYESKGRQDSALNYFLLALKNSEDVQNKSGICRNAMAVGEKLLARKEPDRAAPYLEKAFSIAKAIGQRTVVFSTAGHLAEYYRQKGDFKKANEYLQEYIGVKDSIFRESSAKSIAEMQTKYETEKKEQQIKIQDLKIARRGTLLVIVLILFFVSAAVGYLVYNRNKLKQQALLQAEMLKQQEARSKAVLEAEEQERQRIGKDLHDGVGQLLSALKLNLSNYESRKASSEESFELRATSYEQEKEEGSMRKMKMAQHNALKNAMDLADEAVREVRSISHNMMPNILLKSGLTKAVREFISKISNDRFKITLEISGIDERLDGTVETVFFRVLQELVNNIIKHAAASHVTIQLLRYEKELTLMVEDNGKGFDVKVVEEKDGIGLKNISSRVAYLNGSVHYDSSPGKGTTVTVEVPI